MTSSTRPSRTASTRAVLDLDPVQPARAEPVAVRRDALRRQVVVGAGVELEHLARLGDVAGGAEAGRQAVRAARAAAPAARRPSPDGRCQQEPTPWPSHQKSIPLGACGAVGGLRPSGCRSTGCGATCRTARPARSSSRTKPGTHEVTKPGVGVVVDPVVAPDVVVAARVDHPGADRYTDGGADHAVLVAALCGGLRAGAVAYVDVVVLVVVADDVALEQGVVLRQARGGRGRRCRWPPRPCCR